MQSNHKHIFTPQNLQMIVDEVMNTSFGDIIGNNATIKSPAININENETSYTIDVIAPGLGKSDFQVSISDNKLHIIVAKPSEYSVVSTKSVKKEWDFSSFNRSFRLSPKVETTAIKAEYNLGILNITLPKKEEEKVEPQLKIDIQ
jgi:HSP20 family protein